jgi:uncharacterized protein YrzB (UPF0473 family)
MSDYYGSDFVTIIDEDGVEYELEILSTLEYNGETYIAVVPADGEEHESLDVSILKSVDEDGEAILCAIEDDEELEAVYSLMMDSLYEEDEDE